MAHKLVKFVALLLLLLALAMLALDVKIEGHSSGSIFTVMTGGALVMIFCANASVNDERVEQLKLRAVKVGLLSGTLFAVLAYFLATMSGDTMMFSAFDILFLIMLTTHGYFYFWCWRDSRPLD
jgi:hypothetical protein